MADKNIQMTQRNAANTDWDNLNPLTKASNVKFADGTTVEAHKADYASDGVHGLDATIAKFKTGSSTYTDNDTSQIFTDAFCTASSLIVISITSVTLPQGTWSVEAGTGTFTITSTVAESADITFDYFITKVV